MDRIPMTREGYEKRKAELDELNRQMIDMTQKVADARAEGDLKENAEYHATRERQGQIQAKINLLKDQLSRAEFVDPAQLPKDTVVFGARVRVMDLDHGYEEAYELVGPGQEDHDNEELLKILVTTPVAEGLIGKKVGDIAEISAPAGTIRYKILEITPPVIE